MNAGKNNFCYWRLGGMILVAFCIASIPGRTQSVDTLVNRMLRDNPLLEALRKDYEAATYKEGEFKDFPDPVISMGFFPLPVETRLGPQQLKIGVTQSLPWNNVLANRALVAREEADLLKVQFEIAEEDLTLRIRQVYARIWKIDREIELLEERIPLIQAWYRVSLSKMSANQAGASDVLQIQIFLNEIQNIIQILEKQQETYRVSIDRLLGVESGIPGDQDKLPQELELDTLIMTPVEPSTGQSQLPDLDWYDQELQVSGAILERNQSEGYPTIGLGLDYVIVGKRTDGNPQHNGRDIVMPMLSVKMPIYRQKYKAVRQRENARQASIHLKRRDKELEIQENIETALLILKAEQENLRFYENQIEILDRTIDILTTGYSTEGNKFDELLKLHNQLIDFALKELDSKVKMHIANLTIKRWQP